MDGLVGTAPWMAEYGLLNANMRWVLIDDWLLPIFESLFWPQSLPIDEVYAHMFTDAHHPVVVSRVELGFGEPLDHVSDVLFSHCREIAGAPL